jgi:hypothetical protein
MSAEWVFVDSNRLRSKNRLTPPTEVRELVVGEHEFHEECVYWYYDTETGLAVISNQGDLDLVSFGYSKVHGDNSIVPDAGLIDAAFDDVSSGDSFVFLGEKGVFEKENCSLYFLHQNQLFKLIKYPNIR